MLKKITLLAVAIGAFCICASAQISPKIQIKPNPGVELPVTKKNLKISPTINVSENYINCNKMQIHLARANEWDDIYLGYGVTPDALADYKSALLEATKGICSESFTSTSYRKSVKKVLAFRRTVDKRNAELLGIPIESASKYRLGALYDLRNRFEAECFDQPSDAAVLDFSRFPLTPNIADLPMTSPSEAIGSCSNRSRNPMGGGKNSMTPVTRSGLANLSQCLGEYATQATSCNNPAGTDAFEARQIAGEALAECSGNSNCTMVRNESSDGTTTTTLSISYGEGDGFEREDPYLGVFNQERTEMVFVERDGEILSLRATIYGSGENAPTFVRNIDFKAPPPPAAEVAALPMVAPSMTPAQVSQIARYEMARFVAGLAGVTLPPVVPSSNQCESFQGSGNPSVTFLGAQSSGGGQSGQKGLKGPLMTPDDAIASCLCESGRYGKQLANSMGRSCGGQSQSVEDRMFCMRAGGGMVQNSDRCTSYAREAGGRSLDVSAMCSAVIQCPQGSTLKGSPVDGRLQCGCGRQLPAGGSQDNRCGSVVCPGPGQSMSGAQAQCCERPEALVLTPRLERLQALSRVQLPIFQQTVPLEIERALDARIERLGGPVSNYPDQPPY